MSVRLVRLDGDDSDDAETLPAHCETAKLLARLVEIDDACFPCDAGGIASARAWASSRRLRRAARLAAAYEDAEPAVDGGDGDAASRARPKRVVAFASFVASSMCFEITKVACDPAARRRGHARRAVAAILAEARRRNAPRVALRVETANAAAAALYASLGFREDASRARAHEDYYGAGRNGAVFEYLT